VWREFCKRCYEAKVEVAQPLTSSQFDKERKAASERCVGITAAATINASLERELNLFNVYSHNRQRFDDLLKANDALKELIMSIREESTAKGGGEPVNKKQKKFHASLMEFKKAVDWAGENGLLFGDTMIDSIVASSKTANTTARRAHMGMINKIVDWCPTKFCPRGPGPTIMALYMRPRVRVEDELHYISPRDPGVKIPILTAFVPGQQCHWFYTEEAKDKRKWRTGADGGALWQAHTEEDHAVMLLVLSTPRKDSSGAYVPTSDEDCEITAIRVPQPVGPQNVAMDCFTIFATVLKDALTVDNVADIWAIFKKALIASETITEQKLAPMRHAKVAYIVQDPKSAKDFEGKSVMRMRPMPEILLLSQKHVGMTLTGYNLDVYKEYDHNRIGGQAVWDFIIKAAMEALGHDVRQKMAAQLDFGGMSANQRKFMSNLSKM